MFNLLSVVLHLVNSVFSAIYVSHFHLTKYNKNLTAIWWGIIYFLFQIIIFEVIQGKYVFNDAVEVIINILLFLCLKRLFFVKGTTSVWFACFSFIAGKEIVKYIVSVFNIVLGLFISGWVDNLVLQGKIVTNGQVVIINNTVITVMLVGSVILYSLIFGTYLLLICKKYVGKEFQLNRFENLFLLLPSITSLCISITIKMMIVNIENGATSLIYDTVPATMFWVPLICFLLLGAIVANVILFQNVVHYHEENRKCVLLENQVHQMQKEVKEIQEIYSDIRGLRHDLITHISNITEYVNKYMNSDIKELNCYIKNMEDTVNRLEFNYHSGNPITDIIIHQKQQEAEKFGINFAIDFIFPNDLQIDSYDIGIVLNNVLENAIEATSYVDFQKYISLHSYVKGNLFFIEVENTFNKDLIFNKESGLPKSSKLNKKYHGMGLSNVQRCARKYKGDIDIVIGTNTRKQQVFNLTVMMNGKTNIQNT